MNSTKIFYTNTIHIILFSILLTTLPLNPQALQTSGTLDPNIPIMAGEKSNLSDKPIRSALTGVYSTKPVEETKKDGELPIARETPPMSKPGKIAFHKGIPPTPEEQEIAEEPQLFTVYFSGYVKPEFFWDSRQNVGCRNDQLLIYPEPKELDRCGRDIQAHPEYGMIALESRVRAEIIGPDVLGAQAKGYIEADFWGISDKTLNVFRMRHAYTNLNWEKISLLFGQYWHPMYVPECAPDTIACNGGAPIDPFKRSPQIRFTRRFKPFEITIAALSEVNFTNDGPIGPSCTYIHNAVIPNLSAQLQGRWSDHICGLVVDCKRLVPRLKSDLNVKVEESIYSASFAVYAAFNWETFALRLKGTFGQNCADHGMLGGYAVHTIQPESDKRTYTNLNSFGVWADFNRANSKIEPGCFIGYTKNLGASKTIIPSIKKEDQITQLTYGFGTQMIDYVLEYSHAFVGFSNRLYLALNLSIHELAMANLISAEILQIDHPICIQKAIL